MSDRDIQPSAMERVSSVPVEVVASSGTALPPVESPFRKVHRNLRGRYLWAALLGVVGATCGAYAGWRSQEPLYRGEGIIYIQPSMPSPQDPTGQHVLPMFKGFVAFQVRVLESLNATHLAMETKTWQETGEGMGPQAIGRFVERRRIIHEGDTQHIQIHFVDERADIAVAGVRALIEAYTKLSAEENSRDDRLAFVTTQAEVFSANLKDGAEQILKLTSDYGGEEGLEMRHRAAVSQVLAVEDELGKLQGAIRNYTGAPGTSGSSSARSANEIAIESPQMADSLLQVDLLQAQEELLTQTMGDKNERLVSLRQEIQIRKKRIDRFVEDWNRTRAVTRAGGATLDELKSREAALLAHLNSLREESRKFGKTRVDVGRLRAENEDLARRHEQMKALKDQLSAQLVGKGRISVADEGRRPALPFRDRRQMSAVMGGLFGGFLGVLVIFLLGLRDRRFRNTEDVGSSLSRLRMLGLMPALPSDLSDPQAAEIAAHCVHQIRTLLQIGHARDHGACICITGPGVGSGKTTLSTALGLSFSSSGARTLLVDADLTGRGLTRRVSQMLLSHARRVAAGTEYVAARDDAEAQRHLLEPLVQFGAPAARPEPQELCDLLSRSIERLGLEAVRESGVITDLFALADLLYRGEARVALTALLTGVLTSAGACEIESWIPPKTLELETARPEFNGHPLDEYLFPTGIGTLRFLPLRGLGGRGEVSVATITKILTRVRGEFDIALVDTGPVPGAVETPMVASHADAVVFVVSPSDHRPSAERAVALMEDVGARVAGVVFNRAGVKDVLKVSRSLSVPDGTDGR